MAELTATGQDKTILFLPIVGLTGEDALGNPLTVEDGAVALIENRPAGLSSKNQPKGSPAA